MVHVCVCVRLRGHVICEEWALVTCFCFCCFWLSFSSVVVLFLKEACNVVGVLSENANAFSDAYKIVAKRILF